MRETVPFRQGHRASAIQIRRTACVILTLSLAPAGLFSQTPLTLQVSSETAPAGAVVQIKVCLTAPAPVGSGSIAMDLDPTVFGDIAGISVFSSNGDAMGYANVSGQHVDAHFTSPSSGIGQLPGLPAFTITVPVLASAAPGATASVTVDPTGSAWQDAQGNPYAVTVNPAPFVAGGDLSVGNVTPGGGVLPAGAFLRVTGTGFDDMTTVQIDGVSVFSVAFASAQELDVVLGAPTEMTGRHVQVVNASGSQADYYCALPSAPSNSPLPFPGVHPIVPLRAFSSDSPPNNHTQVSQVISDGIALLNQNVIPVSVTISAGPLNTLTGGQFEETIMVPASTLYFVNSQAGLIGYGGGTGITASAPVRMLEFVFASPVNYSSPHPATLFSASASFSSWSWQSGSPAAFPASVFVHGSADFTVSITGAPWLTPSAMQGTAPAALTFTPNVSGLTPGVYNATVTITPAIPGGSIIAATIDFTLTVTAGPAGVMSIGTSRSGRLPRAATTATPLAVSPTSVSWTWQPGTPPPSTTINVSGGGSFLVSLGASWLTTTPTLLGIKTLTAPTTFALNANVSGIGPGVYSGTVSIVRDPAQAFPGPLVNININISLTVTAPTPSGPSTLIATPFSISMISTPGMGQSQMLNVDSSGLYTPFDASLSNAPQFLSLSPFNRIANSSAFFTPQALTVTATANQPGTYYGSIVLTTSTNSITVPVNLYVTAAPGVTPVMASIVDAASGLPGPLSPGETIAIYGSGIGAEPIGPTDAAGNAVTDFQGTQVLIDGIPASLIYASVGQVTAIVPNEIGTEGIGTVQVNWNGLTTDVWGVPLAPPASAVGVQ